MAKLFQQLQEFFSSDPSFNSELLSLLPHSYKRVGHVAIINLHDKLLDFKNSIGQVLLDCLQPSIRTIARFVKPISGVTRKPDIEWLAGDPSFETIHSELNTKFCINPQKVMLSAGNHFERKRLLSAIQGRCDSKFVVLDMFSCVGNLSLPLIKNNSDCSFIFLELNPVAVSYLRRSLELNKIPAHRYTILQGDNRITCPINVADFVLLGYFDIDGDQLLCALGSLNRSKSDCWIQIHDTGNLDAESTVIKDFQTILTSEPFWKLDSLIKHTVKSIGPGLEHWVFDCHLVPK